jgi:hypothetical protein
MKGLIMVPVRIRYNNKNEFGSSTSDFISERMYFRIFNFLKLFFMFLVVGSYLEVPGNTGGNLVNGDEWRTEG